MPKPTKRMLSKKSHQNISTGKSVSVSHCGRYYGFFDAKGLVVGKTDTTSTRSRKTPVGTHISWEHPHNNYDSSVKVAVVSYMTVTVVDALNPEFTASIACSERVLETYWLRSDPDKDRRDVIVADCGDWLDLYEFNIWKGDYRKLMTLNAKMLEQRHGSDILTCIVREKATDLIQNYALIDSPGTLGLVSSSQSTTFDAQFYKWSNCGRYLLVVDSPLRGLSISLHSLSSLCMGDKPLEDVQLESFGPTSVVWAQDMPIAYVGSTEEDVYVYRPRDSIELAISHKNVLGASQDTMVWKQRTAEPPIAEGLSFHRVRLSENSIQPNMKLSRLDCGVNWMRCVANKLYTRVNTRPDGLFIWDTNSRSHGPKTAIIMANSIVNASIGISKSVYDTSMCGSGLKEALSSLLIINDGLSLTFYIEGIMEEPAIVECGMQIDDYQIVSCQTLGMTCLLTILAWSDTETVKLETKLELKMAPPTRTVRRPLHVIEQIQNLSPQVETDDDTTVKKLASDVQKREWFVTQYRNKNLSEVINDNDTFVNKKRRL